MSNAVSLLAFTGFLLWDLSPGEPFDYAAGVFGVVVYAVFTGMDLLWRPWLSQGVAAKEPCKPEAAPFPQQPCDEAVEEQDLRR